METLDSLQDAYKRLGFPGVGYGRFDAYPPQFDADKIPCTAGRLPGPCQCVNCNAFKYATGESMETVQTRAAASMTEAAKRKLAAKLAAIQTPHQAWFAEFMNLLEAMEAAALAAHMAAQAETRRAVINAAIEQQIDARCALIAHARRRPQ